jgi:hypothetical protein
MYANYMMTGQTPELNINPPELKNIDISKLTDSLSDKVNSVKGKITPETEKKETYLYKWRDEKGIIHYTSEKPKAQINKLETIKIDNQTNVVPAVSDESPSIKSPQQQNTQVSSEIPTNVYSADGIKQLFDQAKNIQNQVNEQYEEIERAGNN